MINQNIHQITAVLQITFRQSQRSLIEACKIRRRVKLNNKTPFHSIIPIVFGDNIGLTNVCVFQIFKAA